MNKDAAQKATRAAQAAISETAAMIMKDIEEKDMLREVLNNLYHVYANGGPVKNPTEAYIQEGVIVHMFGIIFDALHTSLQDDTKRAEFTKLLRASHDELVKAKSKLDLAIMSTSRREQ